MKRSFEQLNWAYLIPPQCGVVACAEGGAGIGKTKTTESLAIHTRRAFYSYELSQAQPEDLQGFPVVSEMKHGRDVHRYMEFVPDERLLRARMEPSVILLDEITNVVAPKQAAALRLVQDPPDNCWMFMACNPVDIAVDGQPLAAPFVNRIWYGEWEMDLEAQDFGFANKLAFPPPSVPVVPDDYMELQPYWGSLIVNYLKYNPTHRHSCPDDEAKRSKPWASPRQWANLSKCLAGASAVKANNDVMTKITKGLVGNAIGTQFMEYVKRLDLPTAEEMLNDHNKFVYTPCDVSMSLLSVLSQHIIRNPNEEVFEKSLKLSQTMAVKNEEFALVIQSVLKKVFPKQYGKHVSNMVAK